LPAHDDFGQFRDPITRNRPNKFTITRYTVSDDVNNSENCNQTIIVNDRPRSTALPPRL
jgi:hypothetical protein